MRDNNLFVVDVATQTEQALTTDGSAVVFNGKADWVYFEEIFDRARRPTGGVPIPGASPFCAMTTAL